MDLATFLTDPSKVTLTGLLLWLVYAFVTEKIVPGRHHRRELKAREDACDKQTANLRDESARLLRDRNDAMDELRAQDALNRKLQPFVRVRRTRE